MATQIVNMSAQVTTTAFSQTITAPFTGNGVALTSTLITSGVTVVNSGPASLQYRIDNGDWVILEKNEGNYVPADLSVNRVSLKRLNDGIASARVDYVTESMPTSYVGPNGEAFPVNISPAVITGYRYVGSIATASPGVGYAFTAGQWYRNGVAIGGQTALTYTRASADIGTALTFIPTGIVYTAQGGTTIEEAPNGLAFRMNGFGDSFTVGQGASVTANSYVSLYSAFLGVAALNNGISGTVLQNRNASGGSPLANNGRSRYDTALLGTNKSLYYALQYGFNDARYIGAPATMNVANFITDYSFIITAVLADGVPASSLKIGSPGYITDVGLTTGSSGFAGQTRNGFEEFVTAVRTLATTFGITYVPVYEYMRENGAGTLIGADNIHPNDAGYAAIAAIYENPTMVFDTVAPTAVSAVVLSETPTIVSVTMSEVLSSVAPPAASFSVTGHTISAIAVSGRNVNLTVNTVVAGEILTVAYARSGATFLQDTLGNQVASFSGVSVTNNAGSLALRLLQRAFLNESGTDPNYIYSGNDGQAFTTTPQGGVLNKTLAAAANGSFAFKVLSKNTGNTDQPMIGISTSSTLVAFAALQYALYESSTTATYIALKAGVAQTALNTVVQAVGDIMRISLSAAGTTVTLEVSQDNGGSWTPIYTDTIASAQHYFQGICKGFPGIGELTAVGLT